MTRLRWAVLAVLTLALLAAPVAARAAVYHPERYNVDTVVSVAPGETEISAFAVCDINPEFGGDTVVRYKIKTTGTVQFTAGPYIFPDHIEGRVAGGAEGGEVSIHLVCERTATA